MLLLHLADIHFRKGDVGTAMDPNAHLRSVLMKDAEAQVKRLGEPPTAVLVSGDLAFAADPAEYAFALEWLDELCVRCGTTLASVFVVPGNHDVDRKVASQTLVQALHKQIKSTEEVFLHPTLQGLLTDPESGRYLYKSLDSYNEFAARFFCAVVPPENTIAKRDLRLNDGSVLRLLGLNSAFVSSSFDKQGDLFVDPAAFQIATEPGIENLIMCHHPCSWLRQSVALGGHLDDVARLQLFGHEHNNRVVLGRDLIRIHASAAHPEKTEPGWEPGYNLISLKVKNDGGERKLDIDVHVRVWQNNPGQFHAKSDRTADVFHHTITLDPWTAPPLVEEAAQQPAKEATGVKTESDATVGKADPMDSLREISIRFFKLTISQKSAIAGKLNLIEEGDSKQPDFERFVRVFKRARAQGKVGELDREVRAATNDNR